MDTLQEAILANKPATTEEALNIQTALKELSMI